MFTFYQIVAVDVYSVYSIISGIIFPQVKCILLLQNTSKMSYI